MFFYPYTKSVTKYYLCHVFCIKTETYDNRRRTIATDNSKK